MAFKLRISDITGMEAKRSKILVYLSAGSLLARSSKCLDKKTSVGN